VLEAAGRLALEHTAGVLDAAGIGAVFAAVTATPTRRAERDGA
jgi:hypothetical protein